MENKITDAQIEAAWGNANFGEDNNNKQKVINDTLLKIACGYRTGFTAMSICKELGLVTGYGRVLSLSDEGRRYLYDIVSPLLKESEVSNV